VFVKYFLYRRDDYLSSSRKTGYAGFSGADGRFPPISPRKSFGWISTRSDPRPPWPTNYNIDIITPKQIVLYVAMRTNYISGGQLIIIVESNYTSELMSYVRLSYLFDG
jgi:hypothetical protein